MEDKGRLTISATAPEGTSFEMMNQYVDKLLNIVDTMPEKEAITAITANDPLPQYLGNRTKHGAPIEGKASKIN
jgi:multidrug efflux pump subunit AcrB